MFLFFFARTEHDSVYSLPTTAAIVTQDMKTRIINIPTIILQLKKYPEKMHMNTDEIGSAQATRG